MQIQNLKALHEFTPKHFRLAELLAEGSLGRAECYERAGFSRKTAQFSGGKNWIGKTRERSFYPALYDYYRRLRDEAVGIRVANALSVIDELRTIAFAKITDVVAIPERKTLQRAAIYAAQARKGFGYTDPEDEELLAIDREDRAKDTQGQQVNPLAYAEYMAFAPGASIKLKALDDIPDEIRGAIAEVGETRDGIRVRMHNKLEALDRLARINGMYNQEKEGKPVTITNLNIVVKGSRSKLLSE